MVIRRATPEDAEGIAAVYSAGVAERVATFQEDPLDPRRFRERIEAGELFLIAVDDAETVQGASWVSSYDPLHGYYAGVGEATVFVAAEARRRGVGRALLEALGAAAAGSGRYKLVAKIFATNEPSLALFRAGGFREVGTHYHHGRLDGEWKDVVVVERMLESAN